MAMINPVKNVSNLIKADHKNHIWQFSRVGGVNRVNLVSGTDLVFLEQLDQKLWTVLSCPAHGLEIDSRTLELIDSDHDGQIRVPEVINAVNWIVSVINNPDDLLHKNQSLPLNAINAQTDEGKIMLASAKQILVNLGKTDASEISVEETSDIARIFASTKFNGDGIITENSTDDEELKKLIRDIISCMGSVTDRSGEPGINTEIINNFYQHCEDFSGWKSIAETYSEQILPFGENTAEAQNAYLSVKSKIDDYFLRCRLSEYDSNSATVLNTQTAQYENISSKELSSCPDEIAKFPIAKINAKKILPLEEAINPIWEDAMKKFNKLVIVPLYSKKTHLSFDEWEALPGKFASYNKWMSEKKGAVVESLEISTIRNILNNHKKDVLLSLIEKDKSLESEANHIFMVDKMVRYYRDLNTLLKNFVNFYDFYSPGIKAVFQAGTLYFDQRCCDLCIKVSDFNKHAMMAGSSGICLLYCECRSKKRNEKMTIVAAMTDGDIDNISVGRNAIFYDRQGEDWDATIVKVIDNPISIRQAFWSPYRRISKFISSSVEKIASSKDKQIQEETSSHVEKAASKVEHGIDESLKSKSVETTALPVATTAPAQPQQPFDIGKFVGIFAAISLALGAIGSVIVSILTGFFKLTWWEMPLALLGIMLAISLPSMVLAYLKLRKRNLAPVLDANGWAINAKLTINIIFGRTLTHLATLPENARINLIDPFSKKKKPIIPVLITTFVILAIAAYLLWHYGYLYRWGIL